MGRVAVLATCALNQWALDYQGNMERIIESVRRAKTECATYLCTPEMSIVGYSCGDHYHESDTEMHAWEVLATILQHPECQDIMVDVGLPVMHKNVLYNCKLAFLNKRILLIRPKMILANDSFIGYGETRWFTEWTKIREVEEYLLPQVIRETTGQSKVPFGDGIIVTKDTTLGYEICEELWNPESCHVPQCFDGVEIISNGLGAHEEFGRPGIGYRMVEMATMKSGGCYLLANQRGCDGSKGYFPGDACIGLNGNIVAYASLYAIDEVEVVTACVDMESIRRYKASIRSRCLHAAKSKPYPRIEVDFCVADAAWLKTGIPPEHPKEPPFIPTRSEQILKAPACWLWDYLRRSGYKAVLIPLSGDTDSTATAAIAFSMCHLLMNAIKDGNKKVLADLRMMTGDSSFLPQNVHLLSSRLIFTSCTVIEQETHNVGEIVNDLALQIQSQHISLDLEKIIRGSEEALLAIIRSSTDHSRKDRTSTGSKAIDKFRVRISNATTHFLAECKSDLDIQGKNLLVLSSCSFDNKLKASNHKNGDSVLDLNLIGNFPEKEILSFLQLAGERLNLPVLQKVMLNVSKRSEADSEVHEDISAYINLQAVEGCGPFSMFGKMCHASRKAKIKPNEVAEKVKSFFRRDNSHWPGNVFLPKAFYMPSTGPPNETRPIFYPQAWSWQFVAIDEVVKLMETLETERKTTKEE